jgi:hypothetical protein
MHAWTQIPFPDPQVADTAAIDFVLNEFRKYLHPSIKV